MPARALRSRRDNFARTFFVRGITREFAGTSLVARRYLSEGIPLFLNTPRRIQC